MTYIIDAEALRRFELIRINGIHIKDIPLILCLSYNHNYYNAIDHLLDETNLRLLLKIMHFDISEQIRDSIQEVIQERLDELTCDEFLLFLSLLTRQERKSIFIDLFEFYYNKSRQLLKIAKKRYPKEMLKIRQLLKIDRHKRYL